MVIVCAAILISVVTVMGFLENWPAGIWQSSLGLLGGIIFVVLFTQIAVREQKARTEVERLATELSQANQKLREYAAQVEELATTQERNRLAREIHDSLGHYLTVINVQLEAAKAVLTHDATRALDALTKAQSLARDGLAEVRRSVATLRSSPLDNLSLPEAVTALMDECRAAGIAAELTVKNDPRPLAPPIKLTLYRAAQEGLTNVRKHAQASQIKVTLDYSSEQIIRLVIQDNGLGTKEITDTGFGLLGIRERVHLLDGQVDTHAEPNQGFTLKVEVPG
jgi:signal transduction histidine kinase